MFNIEQFEKKLYSLVIDEVNLAYADLKEEGIDALRAKGVDLQCRILRALDLVAEEAVANISHGLLLNIMASGNNKLPLYDMKKRKK